MKKYLLKLSFALIVIASFCFILKHSWDSSANAEINAHMKGEKKKKKILVTYFSWGGNTKHIAQKIQTKTKGDIFEITPAESYPSNYHATTVMAKEQIEKRVEIPLKNNIDISGYDVIFVGTPAWWYTMAPPVKTFLIINNFEGKTIVPFITHGGGGEYSIKKEMGEYANGSKVLNSISIYNKGDDSTDSEISEWLNGLKM